MRAAQHAHPCSLPRCAARRSCDGTPCGPLPFTRSPLTAFPSSRPAPRGSLSWVSQGGLAKGAPKVVAEFRKARSLQPLKLLLLGPLAGVPGCLESELAATIAREYGVVHVSAAALVAESLAAESELADRVRAAKAAADKAKAAELPDELMAELVAAKLNSAPCTNQGWVLDGWAQTLARLRLLAPEKEEAGDEAEEAAEEEEGEEGEARPRAPADLTPEHVLVLHMGAEALKGRVQGMGQEEVEASGLTADALLRATQAYAQASAPEGPHNPLMHKALKQLEPLELEQANETAETMLSRARLYLGKPRNYGPTPEETAARAQRQATLRAEAQTQAAKLEAERLEVRRASRAAHLRSLAPRPAGGPSRAPSLVCGAPHRLCATTRAAPRPMRRAGGARGARAAARRGGRARCGAAAAREGAARGARKGLAGRSGRRAERRARAGRSGVAQRAAIGGSGLRHCGGHAARVYGAPAHAHVRARLRLRTAIPPVPCCAQTRSAPLRAYLMSEVIPTLTEGLIEVTKVRPEDPVDFLAEWIFKNNPVLD